MKPTSHSLASVRRFFVFCRVVCVLGALGASVLSFLPTSATRALREVLAERTGITLPQLSILKNTHVRIVRFGPLELLHRALNRQPRRPAGVCPQHCDRHQ